MLKEIHGHIVHELQQNARTDTVFVVAAVLFNLVVLGINWGVANEAGRGEAVGQNDLILGLLIAATLVINAFATRALIAGRSSREKLLGGLTRILGEEESRMLADLPALQLSREGRVVVIEARFTREQLAGWLDRELERRPAAR